jgi:hypothetical protein
MKRMHDVLLVAAMSLVVCAGCSKKDGSAGSSAGAGSGATTTASSGGAIDKNAISFKPTGKWQKADDGKNEVQLWSITNHASKKSFYAHVVLYYYDSGKKQIGRHEIDVAPMNIEPGKTIERVMGQNKAEEPKGTEYREAVFTKANFDGNTTFSDTSVAPPTRPMQGS